MLTKLNHKFLLYLDIETVMMEEKFSSLSPKMQELFLHKAELAEKAAGGLPPAGNKKAQQQAWEDWAALWPEFGKVICISMGVYVDGKFKTMTIADASEQKVLTAFKNVLNDDKYREYGMIAHNGKGFDYPFLVKRFLINDMNPPKKLHTFGLEPWKNTLYDSKEVWKFGSYDNISLELLAELFGLPSPKEEMKGKDVFKHFYAGEIDKIKKYCAGDVKTLASLVNIWCTVDCKDQREEIIKPDA
jgi:predicted PolB exonuclease-like 3'-5' exonuclease